MWRDALRTVVIAARSLVLGAALVSGAALTMRVAWFGWHLDPRCIRGFCHSPIRTARLRVRAARDAITQYMIETPSCPHVVDALVAGRVLDRSNAKDPWGSPLRITCTASSRDEDGGDAISLGPDKELGTADDINSWEL